MPHLVLLQIEFHCFCLLGLFSVLLLLLWFWLLFQKLFMNWKIKFFTVSQPLFHPFTPSFCLEIGLEVYLHVESSIQIACSVAHTYNTYANTPLPLFSRPHFPHFLGDFSFISKRLKRVAPSSKWKWKRKWVYVQNNLEFVRNIFSQYTNT